MNNFIAPIDKFEKGNRKKLKISELEKAIQKAEVEGRIEDVEKLKKELKDLTHESFWDKFIKGSIMY